MFFAFYTRRAWYLELSYQSLCLPLPFTMWSPKFLPLLFTSIVLTFDQLILCLLCPLLYKALLEERDITIDGNYPCHQILPYKDNRNSPPLSEYIQNAASNHSLLLEGLTHQKATQSL